ncbi:PREDICTED: mulatexin-like, partial [Ficedula albicollis]|uniref:mulatexin-like n=1 Tax=Ficedula albicollis TaxID=59894 RepID=UPI0007AD8AF6
PNFPPSPPCPAASRPPRSPESSAPAPGGAPSTTSATSTAPAAAPRPMASAGQEPPAPKRPRCSGSVSADPERVMSAARSDWSGVASSQAVIGCRFCWAHSDWLNLILRALIGRFRLRPVFQRLYLAANESRTSRVLIGWNFSAGSVFRGSTRQPMTTQARRAPIGRSVFGVPRPPLAAPP